jgi:hypothetical protein
MLNRSPTWKGKFFNKAGRLKLLDAYLSTIPTYFLTMFVPKKWVVKCLNKIQWGFLWKGTDDVHGGHCLVKWVVVQRPKRLGGLRVLDLDLFSRALHLQWLWYQWTNPDRPHIGTEVLCNALDKQLFRISTTVALRDGNKARFWQSSWLDGRAPRDIAPNLYKLAWRKHQTLATNLHNDN